MNDPARVILLVLATLSGEAVWAASYEATVTFGQRVELGLPVSGLVKAVNIMTGQRVSAGQILVALDDTPFRAVVTQAEADVEQCATGRTVATRDHEQARQLYERSMLSNVELENAKLDVDRADAACKQAQSRLTLANYHFEHSKIAAPFDGWVLDVRTRSGESVNSAMGIQPLLVVAEEGSYVARVRMTAERAALLRIGGQAQVIAANQTFPGWIVTAALEPAGRDNGGARYEIGVAFKTGGLLLRGGQSARVEFERPTQDAR